MGENEPGTGPQASQPGESLAARLASLCRDHQYGRASRLLWEAHTHGDQGQRLSQAELAAALSDLLSQGLTDLARAEWPRLFESRGQQIARTVPGSKKMVFHLHDLLYDDLLDIRSLDLLVCFGEEPVRVPHLEVLSLSASLEGERLARWIEGRLLRGRTPVRRLHLTIEGGLIRATARFRGLPLKLDVRARRHSPEGVTLDFDRLEVLGFLPLPLPRLLDLLEEPVREAARGLLSRCGPRAFRLTPAVVFGPLPLRINLEAMTCENDEIRVTSAAPGHVPREPTSDGFSLMRADRALSSGDVRKAVDEYGRHLFHHPSDRAIRTVRDGLDAFRETPPSEGSPTAGACPPPGVAERGAAERVETSLTQLIRSCLQTPFDAHRFDDLAGHLHEVWERTDLGNEVELIALCLAPVQGRQGEARRSGRPGRPDGGPRDAHRAMPPGPAPGDLASAMEVLGDAPPIPTPADPPPLPSPGPLLVDVLRHLDWLTPLPSVREGSTVVTPRSHPGLWSAAGIVSAQLGVDRPEVRVVHSNRRIAELRRGGLHLSTALLQGLGRRETTFHVARLLWTPEPSWARLESMNRMDRAATLGLLRELSSLETGRCETTTGRPSVWRRLLRWLSPSPGGSGPGAGPAGASEPPRILDPWLPADSRHLYAAASRDFLSAPDADYRLQEFQLELAERADRCGLWIVDDLAAALGGLLQPRGLDPRRERLAVLLAQAGDAELRARLANLIRTWLLWRLREAPRPTSGTPDEGQDGGR